MISSLSLRGGVAANVDVAPNGAIMAMAAESRRNSRRLIMRAPTG
jgi:hypothetical protein